MSEFQSSSIWQHKPWWCQPWTILLTGVTLISGSWLIFHLIWLTILVSIPILTWMIFFIIIYPKLVVKNEILNIPDQGK
jgi:hypothetical protein